MQGCSCVWLEELCRGGCKMKYSVQNSIHCWCCWIFISKALQNKYWFTFEGWTGFELCKSNAIIPSCSSRIGQTYGKKIANNCYAWLNNGWVRKLVCKNIILVASFNIPLLEASNFSHIFAQLTCIRGSSWAVLCGELTKNWPCHLVDYWSVSTWLISVVIWIEEVRRVQPSSDCCRLVQLLCIYK